MKQETYDSEVRPQLEKVLHNYFPDIVFEIPNKAPPDDDYCGEQVEISVSRTDYPKVEKAYSEFANFFKALQAIVPEHAYFVKFVEQTPPLVQAELGDFVLIHSGSLHFESDEESSVGLVTRKTNTPTRILYGTRYIRPDFDHMFMSSILTKEGYGGNHIGFLRVLSKEEATLHLQKSLQRELNKRIQKMQEWVTRETQSISQCLSDMQTTGKKVISELYLADYESRREFGFDR